MDVMLVANYACFSDCSAMLCYRVSGGGGRKGLAFTIHFKSCIHPARLLGNRFSYRDIPPGGFCYASDTEAHVFMPTPTARCTKKAG